MLPTTGSRMTAAMASGAASKHRWTSPRSLKRAMIVSPAAPGVTPGWDSVANLGFIAAVEDEFGVTISTSEALRVKSLGDMASLIAAKGKGT